MIILNIFSRRSRSIWMTGTADFWMTCSRGLRTCRRTAGNPEKEKCDKDWSKSVSIIQVCSSFVQVRAIYRLQSAAEEQDLGRLPILHPPGKIPESVSR